MITTNGQSSVLSAIPERIRILMEGAIIPSPHSIDLVHSAASDFLYRQVRTRPHVAELYHENSKLDPFSTLDIPADAEALAQARRWYFETAYHVEEELIRDEGVEIRRRHDALPAWLRRRLAPFREPGPVTDLLFAADLLLLHDGAITRVVPESDFLWVERLLSRPEAQLLPQMIWRQPAVSSEEAATALFVVACPWRYMLFYGPRGYRHTLMDVGRLLAWLEAPAPEAERQATVYQDFYDRGVDRFVMAEGVERSVYAVVTFPPSSPATN